MSDDSSPFLKEQFKLTQKGPFKNMSPKLPAVIPEITAIKAHKISKGI